MERIDPFGLTLAGLRARAREILPGGSGVAAPLYSDIFLHGRFEPEGYGLSDANARSWREAFEPDWPAILKTDEAPGEDGLVTRKALLGFRDGATAECVLIPMPEFERSTLCVSTQSGCRMGCAFCETGRGGFRRNLSAGEIVAQAMAARFLLGWTFRNAVFPGMGEPLDNAENLITAIRVMNEQNGLALDAERLTVCTAGPPGGIAALALAGFKRLNLSVSLNAGTDETRTRLMPVNRARGIAGLLEDLAAYPKRKNFVFGVHYCLIPGLHDSRDEARGAADFCKALGRAMLNLIPYNPGSAPIARAPTEEEIDRFAGWIREEGVPIRRRTTRGRGIMAACGQLAGTARNQLAGTASCELYGTAGNQLAGTANDRVDGRAPSA